MASAGYIIIAGLAGLSLAGQPLRAASPNVERPMVDHVEDAVTQPAKDINLKKDEIPPRLLEIQKAPYDLTGMTGCRAITTEIASLRPMLGPDINEDPLISRAEKRERSVSRVAGGILGGFIPFRGVLREVTGANAARERYQRALSAGFARRSFLKGLAVSKGCMPPPSVS
ncbi:hypothetical protein C8024_19300 [Sphingopyxis sp. BSNA05]|uniref:hypothetical protein n=1 Tax=Sphingomonadales TaxID=204457 RepID=UPI000C1E0A97|nr:MULTISPECIES: hypothetical protein [Sphingomonadaceae]ATW04539.1 hypothetical protein CHN51_14095 [Sphingorhabdus sp. YGSMI21]NRD91132.1 hypothetical protein [Sphingopyxis sp. BSNA05]